MTPDNTQSATSDYPPAGLRKRLAAMVYDSFLVLAICLAVTALTLPIRLWLSSSESFRGADYSAIEQAIVFILLIVTIFSFFTWFWRRTGQTLGMQTWQLKVESLSGGELSLRQCLIRLLGATLSIACFGVGYWWMLFDEQKRTWHDRWSDSRVVQLPKKNK